MATALAVAPSLPTGGVHRVRNTHTAPTKPLQQPKPAADLYHPTLYHGLAAPFPEKIPVNTPQDALEFLHFIESREIHLPPAVCNLVLAHALKWKHLQDLHGTKADAHTRAQFCSEFIQALYLTLTPADDYVKATDPPHSTEVHELVTRILPNASVEVQIAALFHDFERYSFDLRVPRFANAQLDEEVRKQVVHPRNAARIARALLQPLRLLSGTELDTVCFFIRHHDQKDVRDQVYLAGEVVLESVKGHPLLAELECLQCADAAAFFRTTLEPFIVEMTTVRKEELHKVQKRILTNFHRIPDEFTKQLVRSELRKWAPETVVGQCVAPIVQ